MTMDRPFTGAEQANHDAVRKALGALGLHDQRRMIVSEDTGQFEIVVSAFELLKLTAAVTDLERLVLDWYCEGVEGREDMLAAERLHLWAEGHDFSHLEPVPSPE